MENQNNFYSVSDLAAKLNVPRTTINDWLKKFDRYIDFEIRGRRKVYTEASLDVLKIISASKDKGQSIAELEKELAAKCAVRPEVSTLSDETEEKPAAVPAAENTENLPAALPSSDAVQALQQLFERCGKDLENHVRAQDRIRRRGFTLVAVLLVLLLGAACATLLLLGQLLTLKESSKALEMRLAASKEETLLLRKNTQKEFKLMAAKVEASGVSNTQAVSALQEKLTSQRQQFEVLFRKLEQADQRREKALRRVEKLLEDKVQENFRLKNNLDNALKTVSSLEKQLASSQAKYAALQQKNTALAEKNAELDKLNKSLEKKIREEKNKRQSQTAPALSAKSEEIKK